MLCFTGSNWPERRQQGTAGTAAEQKMPPTLRFCVPILPATMASQCCGPSCTGGALAGPGYPTPLDAVRNGPREKILYLPAIIPDKSRYRGACRGGLHAECGQAFACTRPYTLNPRAQPGTGRRSDRSCAPHIARPPNAQEAACSWRARRRRHHSCRQSSAEG